MLRGTATLDFGQERFSYSAIGTWCQPALAHLTSVDRILLGNSSSADIVLTTSMRVPAALPASWERVLVKIGANYNSTFFSQVTDLVMAPTGDSNGRLVLNPDDANAYALDGQWFYARITSNSFPELMASVSVGSDQNPTNPRPFRINPTEQNHILPQESLSRFVDILDELGFHIIDGFNRPTPDPGGQRRSGVVLSHTLRGYHMISMIGGSFQEIHADLPTLHFFVQLENGESIQLPLYAEDYMNIDSQSSNNIQITFAADDSRPLTIGQGLLSRMALHIDPRNNRIGFADPSSV